MARGLALAFLVGVTAVVLVAATREPSEPVAVAALVTGIGLASFGAAATTLYYLPPWIGVRRSRRRARTALRRGALLGAGVAALALLRALDALNLVTVAFVLAALAALEGVLSARG